MKPVRSALILMALLVIAPASALTPPPEDTAYADGVRQLDTLSPFLGTWQGYSDIPESVRVDRVVYRRTVTRLAGAISYIAEDSNRASLWAITALSSDRLSMHQIGPVAYDHQDIVTVPMRALTPASVQWTYENRGQQSTSALPFRTRITVTISNNKWHERIENLNGDIVIGVEELTLNKPPS